MQGYTTIKFGEQKLPVYFGMGVVEAIAKETGAKDLSEAFKGISDTQKSGLKAGTINKMKLLVKNMLKYGALYENRMMGKSHDVSIIDDDYAQFVLDYLLLQDNDQLKVMFSTISKSSPDVEKKMTKAAKQQ